MLSFPGCQAEPHADDRAYAGTSYWRPPRSEPTEYDINFLLSVRSPALPLFARPVVFRDDQEIQEGEHDDCDDDIHAKDASQNWSDATPAEGSDPWAASNC